MLSLSGMVRIKLELWLSQPPVLCVYESLKPCYVEGEELFNTGNHTDWFSSKTGKAALRCLSAEESDSSGILLRISDGLVWQTNITQNFMKAGSCLPLCFPLGFMSKLCSLTCQNFTLTAVLSWTVVCFNVVKNGFIAIFPSNFKGFIFKFLCNAFGSLMLSAWLHLVAAVGMEQPNTPEVTETC